MTGQIDIVDALELLKDRADGHIENILAAAIDEIRRLRDQVAAQENDTQRTDR